jgi:hypothetical protein
MSNGCQYVYDYQSNPRPDDTQLTYFVTVKRPNNLCASVDTVFVPLKGIPSVNVKDTAVCHDNPLKITFTDDTTFCVGDGLY